MGYEQCSIRVGGGKICVEFDDPVVYYVNETPSDDSPRQNA